MSYSTGTADTRENLLDLFRAFAITSGWTVDRHAASGTGYVLNIHKTGKYGDVLYASVRSVNYEDLPGELDYNRAGLVVSMSDSYDAGADCVNQPGAPAATTNATYYYASSITAFTAVANYWFFSDTNPEFLAMVILLPDGTFRHLTIFELEKTDLTLGKCSGFFATNGHHAGLGKVLPFETWRDGLEGYAGTSYLRMQADERDGWWTPIRISNMIGGQATEGGVVAAKVIDQLLLDNCFNQFSYAASLCPITLYGANLSDKLFPIGYIPNWRISKRQAFITGEEYILGSDTWMGFPASSIANNYALVYRKVT